MIPAEARGAWREIEARLRPYVARRVGSAADVDDIVQEILVKIHGGMTDCATASASAAGFTGSRRTRSPITRGRVHGLRCRRAADEEVPEDRDAADDEAAGLQADLGKCVALFVARLPSPYREAITLTDLRASPKRRRPTCSASRSRE